MLGKLLTALFRAFRQAVEPGAYTINPPGRGERFGPRPFPLLMLLVVVLWLASIFRSDATIDYLNTQANITNATMELTRMKLRATTREVDRVEVLCREMIKREASR